MKKYSVASNVKPVDQASFSAGQLSAINNNGFTHYAKLDICSRCFSRVPQYFKDECKAAGFEFQKIGGTTDKFIVLGLKKSK
jgi:hypothetical protein